MSEQGPVQAVTRLPLSQTVTRRLTEAVGSPNLLIVVEPRELVRGCLSSWLDSLGEGIEVIGVADARHSLRAEQVGRASAVILSGGLQSLGEAWLEQQVEWLREQRSNLPIAAILEPCDGARIDQLVTRLSLQGHIPTSSSLAVANAALRLIFVGGSYFPRTTFEDLSLSGDGPPVLAPDQLPAAVKLTPRELSVLELLSQGMANKIIAYRLNMSQSTVKVHVHNIISKLNVRNRTEAALLARDMATCRRPSSPERSM